MPDITVTIPAKHTSAERISCARNRMYSHSRMLRKPVSQKKIRGAFPPAHPQKDAKLIFSFWLYFSKSCIRFDRNDLASY